MAANAALRAAATARIAGLGLPLIIPPLALCTDNAAMIGAVAYFRRQLDPTVDAGLTLDVFANLPLPEEG